MFSGAERIFPELQVNHTIPVKARSKGKPAPAGFQQVMIPYIDRVRVNEDGSLNCIGRANKYFVNNEGIRFDAGLVETAVCAEKNIAACGLAPRHDKLMHDTVPVLYVQTSVDRTQERDTVKKALCSVFIKKQLIRETNMPGVCVITDHIPFNAAGKVDVYRILQGEGQGRRFLVRQIRREGRLVDIRLKPSTPAMLLLEDANVPEKLLLDGAKMANDTYKCVGWCSGILIGWILERRFVGFSTEVSMIRRITRLVPGVLGYYAVYLVLYPVIKNWIGGPAGTIVACFIQMFYIAFVYPFCLKYLEKQN